MFNPLCSRFKESMIALVTNLKTKDPFYVRCVKPNEMKSPVKFNDERCLHQVCVCVRVGGRGEGEREIFMWDVWNWKVLSSLLMNDAYIRCVCVCVRVGGRGEGEREIFMWDVWNWTNWKVLSSLLMNDAYIRCVCVFVCVCVCLCVEREREERGGRSIYKVSIPDSDSAVSRYGTWVCWRTWGSEGLGLQTDRSTTDLCRGELCEGVMSDWVSGWWAKWVCGSVWVCNVRLVRVW